MLDIVIATGIAAGAVHGFSTGAVKQVASLFGVFISFAVAFNLMYSVGMATYAYFGATVEVAPLIGFVVVFALVQTGIVVGSKLVERLLGVLKLGIVNRIAGTGVGAAKAILVLSIAFVALGSVGFPTDDARQQSRLYSPVAGFLPMVWSSFSEHTGITSMTDVFSARPSPDSR